VTTIISVTDLKDTSAISEMCHRTDGPVFVTKNGRGDMVLMSIEAYDRQAAMFAEHVRTEIAKAESELASGLGEDYRTSMRRIGEKHGFVRS